MDVSNLKSCLNEGTLNRTSLGIEFLIQEAMQ